MLRGLFDMKKAAALVTSILLAAPLAGVHSTPQGGYLWSIKLQGAPIPRGFILPAPMPLTQGVVAVYPSLTSVSLLDVSEDGVSPLWTVDFGRVPVSQFTTSGDFVYVLTWARKPWSTRLYAIRIRDGAMPWPDGIELDTALRDVPIAYGDGVIVVPMESGEVWGISADYGNRKWSVTLSGMVRDLMIVSGILVVMDEAGLVGIDPGTGNVLWRFDTGEEPVAMGMYGTKVYVVTEGSTLYGLDSISGTRLGRAQLPREPPLPGRIPVWADAVLVATQRAKIFAVGAQSYEVSSLPRYLDLLPQDQPRLLNGILLAVGKFGEVYFMDWNPRGVMPNLLESSLPDAPASDLGLTPDGEIALVYSVDGSLTAFRVPLLAVYPKSVEVQGDGVQLNFVVCSFLSTSSPGVITVISPLGDVLAQEDFISFADGGCMEDVMYVPGAAFYDEIYVSASVGARSSPEEVVEISRVSTGPLSPSNQPVILRTAPGAVVGEPAWVEINVTNVWDEGDISVTVSGEGMSPKEAGPIHLFLGSSTIFRVEVVPLREGDTGLNVSIYLDGTEVYRTNCTVRAAVGAIIEDLGADRDEVSLGDPINFWALLTNRYRDGATLRIEVRGEGVVQVSPTTVGPLRAGESANVSVEGIAAEEGEIRPIIFVLSDGDVLDSAEVGVIRVLPIPNPAPTPAPASGGPSPPGPRWPASIAGLPWETIAAAAAVVMIGAAIYVLGRRGGSRAPRPSKAPTPGRGPPTQPPAEEILPPTRRVEEIPTTREEVEASAARGGAVEEALSKRLRVVRSDLDGVKEALSEGIPGLEERLREVTKVVSEAEVALGLGDLEHAEDAVRRAEDAMESLKSFLEQYRNIFEGPGWAQVDKRISTMLKVWGRAPATMLTMVPPELRLAALQRYLKSHGDMNLELRGDELRLAERG